MVLGTLAVLTALSEMNESINKYLLDGHRHLLQGLWYDGLRVGTESIIICHRVRVWRVVVLPSNP
jgi:hypothetical protein